MRLIAGIALVTISAVTPAAASIAPNKPGKVRVDRAAPTTLKLRGKDRARNETSYKVRAREQGASEWKTKRLRRNKTKFMSRGLEPGTVHEHRVRACGRGGCSGWSPVRRQATLLAPFGPPYPDLGGCGVFPASDLPAMGTRLRLKARYDISGLDGQARVTAEVLKRYGMIVADNGSNWFITGATDNRWNDDDLNRLKDIPGSAFEVVRSLAAPVTPC
jgi:hypothetical protein